MKNKQSFVNYDFSDYEEITGNALFKINGGKQVENTIEAQANAQVGDTLVDSNGVEHTLIQGDITWAQNQIGNGGNPGNGNTGSQNNSSQSTEDSHRTGPDSSSDVPENIRNNSQAYAYYMQKQDEAKRDKKDSSKYFNYNVLGQQGLKSKDIKADSINNKEHTSSDDSNTVYQFGVGTGVFLLAGLSMELGVSYSKKEGFDLYGTGGIGFGMGVSGDLTIGASWSDLENGTLHNSTSTKEVIGAFVTTTYDLTKNAKLDGIGGIGFGGGVLWTGTRTLKGSFREIKNFISDLF